MTVVVNVRGPGGAAESRAISRGLAKRVESDPFLLDGLLQALIYVDGVDLVGSYTFRDEAALRRFIDGALVEVLDENAYTYTVSSPMPVLDFFRP